MALLTRVSTKNTAVYEDGQKGAPISINKIGSPIAKSSLDQAVTDGKAYNIAMATPDTLLTASATYAATDPAIILTVDSGITILVDHLMVTFEDDSGTDSYVAVGYAPRDLYSSGGLASSTANNLNSDVGTASNASDNYNGDTAIVMLDPGDTRRMVYNKCWPFADVNTSEPRIADFKPPVPLPLVGPATFFVYCYASEGGEFDYTLQYREYATDEIIMSE